MRTITKQALGLTAVTLLIPAGLALSLTAITTTPEAPPEPEAAPVVITLDDCEHEDSVDCLWDATTSGNGTGVSFVDVAGVALPITTTPAPLPEPEPAPEPAPVTAPPVHVEPEPIPAPEPVAEPAPVVTVTPEPAHEPVLTFDSLPLVATFPDHTAITPEHCGPNEVLAEDYSCVGTDYWD